MLTKLAASAVFYVTALYLSIYAVTSGNAQCIENGISTNISSELVREGDSVTLSCYVSGAGGLSTSWVNPADEILSVDAVISGNLEPRFAIEANNANPECMVYNLTISNLTMADAGTYACRPTTATNPLSSEAILIAYEPSPIYPECRVTGGSTLVRTGDVLEFICESEPGVPEWDLVWESYLSGTISTSPINSTTTNSELKSITSSLNATADENGKIMSCFATCRDPGCVDKASRNCSLGQIVVVDNPVNEYFFVNDSLIFVTIGGNVSMECHTTLPGAEVNWLLHETVTESYVVETTPTGQSATIYITGITNTTSENPFVCSLNIDGALIATRKASLTLDPIPTTQIPTTVIQTMGPTTASYSTDMAPMNVTATPSMLVNVTSNATNAVNTTSQPGNATTTMSSGNVTTTLAYGNTTLGVTNSSSPNATAAATTPPQEPTTQAPFLRTNTTQQPQNTTMPTTTLQGGTNGTNVTSESGNTTATVGPFDPTIAQRNMTTLDWWKPQTTFFPQKTMFPQNPESPTNMMTQQPSTGPQTTPVASGPPNAIAAFFTLPIIMGIAAVGGLLLIFIVAAIVCVLTSKKRRGSQHDVEELTELSKRNSKPYEVPSSRTAESDPTFAAFGKGTSTQDLINIGDDHPSSAQQNGSNNVGRSNKNNGSDTRPLTANDLLSNGIDNHGMSDSIL
ncbi:mucin-17-like [Lytechinus variegatus]|uniref:mucin-17-like n=1 Tax=Lytechinus variegatus TaxID=7654 RepID=UPI001BB22798|nr:mucin-17-like [Lytechinus variegatus]